MHPVQPVLPLTLCFPLSSSLTLAKSLPALLLKEKAQIDAKLNENVRTELGRTKDGLRKLQEGKAQIARLKEEMIEIEKGRDGEDGGGGSGQFTPMKATASGSSEDVYSKISKVAALHRSLSQTASMVHQLRSMAEKVAHLSQLLASDKNQELGPCGPSPNLLIIHFQLQQLESFRNETLHQAKKQPNPDSKRAEDERRTLEKWFGKLDDLTKEFEGWMWEIAANVVDCTREKNGGVVVRLLKIIEVEGKEDQKVRWIESVHRPCFHSESCDIVCTGRCTPTHAKGSQLRLCRKLSDHAG